MTNIFICHELYKLYKGVNESEILAYNELYEYRCIWDLPLLLYP